MALPQKIQDAKRKPPFPIYLFFSSLKLSWRNSAFAPYATVACNVAPHATISCNVIPHATISFIVLPYATVAYNVAPHANVACNAAK